MGVAIRGVALIVLLAIILFIIWCFIFGACKGHAFGMIPPFPRTTAGKKKDDNDKVNASGSGSGNAGAGGSGGGSLIGDLISRFQNIDVSKGVSQGKKTKAETKPCEGLNPLAWFGCHVSNGWNILTNTISNLTPTPVPYSPLTGQPILVAP